MTLPTAKDFDDAAVGSLLGLAVGDALGAPVEFKARGSFMPVTDFQATEHFGLEPGQWTDDTSQALCLGTALVRDKGYDSWSVMDEYVAWYEEGRHSVTGECFDIGNQTRAALYSFMQSDGIVGAEAQRTESAGNGVIMRLAPAAIVAGREGTSQAAADELCGLSAKETHYSLEAEQATVVFGRLLAGVYRGVPKEDLIATMLTGVQDDYDLVPFLAETSRMTEVEGSGYVRKSLQAAWWSFLTTESFEACVLTAVNLGDDADTTGAIAGQLAGGFYGAHRIPPHWLANLWGKEELEKLALDLLAIPCRVTRSRFALDPTFEPRPV